MEERESTELGFFTQELEHFVGSKTQNFIVFRRSFFLIRMTKRSWICPFESFSFISYKLLELMTENEKNEIKKSTIVVVATFFLDEEEGGLIFQLQIFQKNVLIPQIKTFTEKVEGEFYHCKVLQIRQKKKSITKRTTHSTPTFLNFTNRCDILTAK